jgi:hypothetical protein
MPGSRGLFPNRRASQNRTIAKNRTALSTFGFHRQPALVATTGSGLTFPLRSSGARRFLVTLLAVSLGTAFAAAQTIGVVKVSSKTSIAGNRVTPGQTLFSGDRLTVDDGATQILVGRGSEITLSPHTAASLQRDQTGVTVDLDYGAVSLEQSKDWQEITRIRSANVSIEPSRGVLAHAEVVISSGQLTIDARSGALTVFRDGEPTTVPEGAIVRLEAQQQQGDSQSGTSSPGSVPQDTSGQSPGSTSPSTSTTSGAPSGLSWGKIALCGVAGGAVGSVPLIVNETSASRDQPLYGTFIPVTGVIGAALCYAIPTGPPPVKPPPQPQQPKNQPPTCSASVNPAKIYRPGQGTLNWTSQNASFLGLGLQRSPLTVPAGVKPVSTNGLPPGKYWYTVTALGPGGKAVCKAPFEVLPEPCAQEFQYMNTAFRIKMGLQGANNILTVAGLGFGSLPGSIAGKVIFGSGKVGVLPATQIGKAVIISATGHKIAIDLFAGGAFNETCQAYARCVVSHGISLNGQISFTNALGREIGKCVWTTNGNSTTVTSKVWGWGHAVGILDW